MIEVKESRKEETLKILTWKDIYKDLPFFCIYILCKLRISLNFQCKKSACNECSFCMVRKYKLLILVICNLCKFPNKTQALLYYLAAIT